MKILFYSTKDFERPYLEASNSRHHETVFTPQALEVETAAKAAGFDAICVFPGDDVSAAVIEELHKHGVRFIAARSAGYDNIDVPKAISYGIKVASVPGYSPHAIAEHAAGLVMALNRKLIQADKQVHGQDFRVDPLVGFDLFHKKVGIIGTGRIGSVFARIMHGFGCKLLGYDIQKDFGLAGGYGLEYVSLETLCRESDIISLHVPLTTATRHIIDETTMEFMKPGVMLINTARGACINTEDLVRYLENGRIGYAGLDVYEKEKGLFFYDRSGLEINDPLLKKLSAMPNVLITPHQAFATAEALNNIAETTFNAFNCWEDGMTCDTELLPTIKKLEVQTILS